MDLRRQPAGTIGGHLQCRLDEQIQPLHAEAAQPGNPADVDPEGNPVAPKRGRIHQDKSGEAIRHGGGGPHADRPAPIVGNERHVTQIERLDQRPHIVNPACQGEGVFMLARLVGQSTPNVVRNDNPIAGEKRLDQFAKEERPGRVAVRHQEDGALALVEIVVSKPFNFEIVRLERIEGFPVGLGRTHGIRGRLKAKSRKRETAVQAANRGIRHVFLKQPRAIVPSVAVFSKGGAERMLSGALRFLPISDSMAVSSGVAGSSLRAGMSDGFPSVSPIGEDCHGS